jgi:hypothetical protein
VKPKQDFPDQRILLTLVETACFMLKSHGPVTQQVREAAKPGFEISWAFLGLLT